MSLVFIMYSALHFSSSRYFISIIILFVLVPRFTFVLVPEEPDISLSRPVAGTGEVTGGRVPGCQGGQPRGLCKGILSVVHDGLAVIWNAIWQVQRTPLKI